MLRGIGMDRNDSGDAAIAIVFSVCLVVAVVGMLISPHSSHKPAPSRSNVMDHNELRHCVYCRRIKHECVVEMQMIIRTSNNGEAHFVKCVICGAHGPYHKTAEQAKAIWNENTQVIADAEQGLENMQALVLVSEGWKDRAIASMELSSDLSKLLKTTVDSMQDRAAEISKKHMDDPRHSGGVGQATTDCEACDGAGNINGDKCDECNGKGFLVR